MPLLVGVWGRSVATDHATITASALAMLDADTVAGEITSWITDGAGELDALPDEAVESAVRRVASSGAARLAVEAIVEGVVDAASAPPGSAVSIDVAAALDPVRPELLSALAESGVPASARQVDAVLRGMERLVLASSGPLVDGHTIAGARQVLTLVLLVGVAGLASTGFVATRLASEPVAMVRSLANRLAVSAITFVLFLRLGAWAVDPAGGRAPIRSGGAVLLGSNLVVVWLVATLAVGVSTAATAVLVRRRRRLRRSDPPPVEPERPLALTR